MDPSFESLLHRLNHLTEQFRELREGVRKAVLVADVDPDMALTRARKVLEYVIRDVYERRIHEPPGTRPLENLLQRLVKEGLFPDRLDAYASAIRKLGNVGTHSFGENVTATDVYQSLTQLMPILDWYFEFERPEAFSQHPAPAEPAPARARHSARAEQRSEKQSHQRPPQDSEAYTLYLKARRYWNKRTEGGLRKGIAFFNKALDREPAFALAWAGLADAYHQLAHWGMAPPNTAYPRGKSAALKAIGLDESLTEAHLALAVILKDYDWDFAGAAHVFRRALQQKPDHASGHQWYGQCLACMGRHAEAIAELRRAQELDPLALINDAVLGRHGYFYARQYDQAREQLHRTILTDPSFWIAQNFLGWVYFFQGDVAAGLAAIRTAQELHDNPENLVGLGYGHALAGEPAKAQECLDALTALAPQRFVAAINIALIHIGLGDKDQAFSWLGKACDDHSEWLSEIRVDPAFDPLRSDPRFDALIQRMNIKL